MNLPPNINSIEIDCNGNIVTDLTESDSETFPLSTQIITSMIPKQKCWIYGSGKQYCGKYLSYKCVLQKSCSSNPNHPISECSQIGKTGAFKICDALHAKLMLHNQRVQCLHGMKVPL